MHPLLTEKELRDYYAQYNQDQVFKWTTCLDADETEKFFGQLRKLDLHEITEIYSKSVRGQTDVGDLEPPESYQKLSAATGEMKKEWEDRGLAAIREHKIGVVILGGGAGTRLGYDGPKGKYNIGLQSKKTLFQLFAERVKRLSELAGGDARIPFVVMTSPSNHDTTVNYFKDNNYFGLPQEDCIFFEQGTLPCFSLDGSILLESKSCVASSADGNGGIYPALKKSGVLETLRERKVHGLHVFSVDNALCRPADPRFIGYMLSQEADCGNKSIWKNHPEEKLGVVAMRGNKYCVAEYSELDQGRKEMKDDRGTLMFGAGNICNHFFTIDFLENKVLPNWGNKYHIARKKIPFINQHGEIMKPLDTNGIKLECFIFDVFEMAERFALIECERADEFAPVKNAPGEDTDSPDTARRMLSDLHRRWVTENGGTIEGDGLVEVDPLLSYQGENLHDLCNGKVFQTPVYLTRN